MMVILEDKQNDIKQEFFYDRVPVGGKFRAFGIGHQVRRQSQQLRHGQSGGSASQNC